MLELIKGANLFLRFLLELVPWALWAIGASRLEAQ